MDANGLMPGILQNGLPQILVGGPFILFHPPGCPIPRHFAPRPTTLVTLTSPRLTGPSGPPSPDLCF